ncbi:transcription repressor OFP14 [Humulus lupulus]|uniref:transcription repressor OFP14 n=1 Tax=Humulus lupulus TaxID=3486 RepID=UPI002B416B49|nr:transcription repressor OFP14 [Humulus lupulus]
MAKKIEKCLQDFLPNIKKPKPKVHFPPNVSLSSSKDWILSGCKQPKTLSFAVGRNQNDDSATLTDIDQFLVENFKSLYTKDDVVRANQDSQNDNQDVVWFESPRLLDTLPNLRGSRRFFVSTGISSSLIEESRASITTTATTSTTTCSNDVVCEDTASFSSATVDNDDEWTKLPDQCVAVLANSPKPYDDFRQSMNEMVEARLRRRKNVDWSFMEELLFCYLNLNDKRSYKYILSAFVDLIVDLRRDSEPAPSRSRKVTRTRNTQTMAGISIF